MTQPKTTTKKGDRQRTPRSPFGLPPKRPRPENPPHPPRPSKVLMIVATAARLTVGSPSANPLIQLGRLQRQVSNPVLRLLLKRSQMLLKRSRA